MFLYLSWQDVVSFRVASVASITSNPSVVELSVDDPLSPIFEEETPDIATSVLQSDFPSGDGCSVAAVLPPVATVQTNFQQRKEEGGRANERIGRNFWAKMNDFGGDGWSNDLTMEEEMEEITFDVNRVLLGKFDGKEMLGGRERREGNIYRKNCFSAIAYRY